MLIFNPALTEDAEALDKLVRSVQTSFADFAFFQSCAASALGGDTSPEGVAAFIQGLAAAFVEAGNQVQSSAGRSSKDERPGSYESWVALLRGVLEESGVDLEAVYESSGAAASASQPEEDECDEEGEAEPLSAPEAWAETESETVVDCLLSKNTMMELPDMPFYSGCKVLAVLPDDKEWHPAVVLREVSFNDMWEDGYQPAAEEDAEPEAAATETASSPGGYAAAASTGKRKKKPMKATDIYALWAQGRFFEVSFLEFGKSEKLKFDKLRVNDEVDDDEGVEGMLCEAGECEVCRRNIFLTFHHLIPKQTHNRWLRRKKMPEGVKGYESGSKKKLASSEVQAPSQTSSSKKSSSGKRTADKSGKKNAPAEKEGILLNRQFLNTYGIMVCRSCHGSIHRMASNMDLAKRYNTLERVLNAPLMQGCIGANW